MFAWPHVLGAAARSCDGGASMRSWPKSTPELSRGREWCKDWSESGLVWNSRMRQQPVVVTDIESDPLWSDYKHLA